jgi:hypothetical protein
MSDKGVQMAYLRLLDNSVKMLEESRVASIFLCHSIERVSYWWFVSCDSI